VMEVVGPLHQADVLCIGPRSEAEILQLWAHGFKLSRIKALDLISYSPYTARSDEKVAKELGYMPCTGTDFYSVADLLGCFEGAVGQVYFQHGIVKGKNSQAGSLLAIFSVNKGRTVAAEP